MSKKPITPKQKAELIASFIGDNFIEAARYLREVQDETPELFATVVKYTGIGMRKAYYLAEIDRRFRKLGVDRNRLRRIGWTKVQIIGRHINKTNLEDLLSLAEKHTAYELNALMRGGAAAPRHPLRRALLHSGAVRDVRKGGSGQRGSQERPRSVGQGRGASQGACEIAVGFPVWSGAVA